MSYVAAQTAPKFGSRSQALGSYQRATFPLPTSSLSKVIRTRLGWYNGPYPQYPQQEFSRTRGYVPLSGFVSPSDPNPATERNGAVTYRIDPATGQYRFYAGDILPRGVFAQNAFQPPARPALSALGVPVTRTRVRRKKKVDRGKSFLSCGAGCSCGGRCSALGDDTFIDTTTGCTLDSDGNLLKCPGGTDPYTDIGKAQLPSSPTVLQQVSNVLQQVAAGTAPKVAAAPAPPQSTSWLNRSTRIGSTVIPNSDLAIGGGLAVAALALLRGGGRRR
jgi:hypothetical protein